MTADGGEAAAALRAVGEQLEKLHRRQHEPEPAAEVEIANVGSQRLGAQIGLRGPPVELGDKRRVGVDPGDPVPTAAEVEGDPSGPAAEIEEPGAGSGGQLFPEAQVGGVGATLDVVPEDPLVCAGGVPRGAGSGAHRQNSLARPRSASSRRSSSRAV